MFFGRYGSEFSEQNFAYKSEHDKCVLQRNSRKDFAVFFRSKRKNWANLSWTKVILEHAGSAANEDKVLLAKRRFLGY